MNADWQWVQLGEISEVISKGTTPTTHGVAFLDSGIPFLRAEDVVGGAVDVTSVKYYVSEKTHDTLLARSKLQPGDFLITIAGSLGRVGYVPLNAPPLNCNQAVAFVRLKPNAIDLDFLLYVFQYEGITKSLLDVQKVGTIGNLNLEQIRDFKIPLPPLTEQKQIASLLARADRLRQLRRTAHDLGESLLQSVFLEMFGDPGVNPKKWDILPIEDLLSKTRNGLQTGPFGSSLKRHEYVSEGIPVWGINNLGENKFIEDEPLYITEEKFKQLKNYTVENGDIFVSRAGTVGRMCVAYPSVSPSIIGTNLVRISLDFEFINPEYFTAMFSYFGSSFASLKMTDDENAYSFINPSILRSMRIPVPPLSLQEEFAGVVARVESLQGRMGESTRQVEGLFESLLAQSFSS